MLAASVLPAVLGAGSAGCKATWSGAREGQLSFGNASYPYSLWVPAAAVPVPVVFHFHGWGGSHNNTVARRVAALGAEKGFAVASLQGASEGLLASWNAVGSAEPPGKSGPICHDPVGSSQCYASCDGCKEDPDHCWWTTCIDSVGQIEAFMDEVTATTCVDLDRVYGMGCSNGGMMLYQLAADARTAHRFAAMAPMVAVPHVGHNTGPRAPLPFLALWKSSDSVVPAVCPGQEFCVASGWRYVPGEAVLSKWGGVNQCGSDTAPFHPAAELPSTASCTASAGCAADTASCVFPGGHQCTEAMIQTGWDFLRRYSQGNTSAPPPPAAVPRGSGRVSKVEFVGSAFFSVGYQFTSGGAQHTVAELSACGFTPEGDLFLVGDQGTLYQAAMRGNGSLRTAADIEFTSSEPIDRAGQTGVDSEGIAFSPPGALSPDTAFVSLESPLGVDEYRLATGRLVPDSTGFTVPSAVTAGAASNGGFEALSVGGEHTLWTINERKLSQDGPTVRRLLQYNVTTRGEPLQQLLYFADDAVPPAAPGDQGFGVVELAQLPGGALLSLERYYDARTGSVIRLYELALDGARSLHNCTAVGLAAEAGVDCVVTGQDAVTKRLLLAWAVGGLQLAGSADVVDISVDNYEAMCVLPPSLTPDSSTRLLLVNDDNANPQQLGTQFVLLEVSAGDRDSSRSLVPVIVGLSLAGAAILIVLPVYLMYCRSKPDPRGVDVAEAEREQAESMVEV